MQPSHSVVENDDVVVEHEVVGDAQLAVGDAHEVEDEVEQPAPPSLEQVAVAVSTTIVPHDEPPSALLPPPVTVVEQPTEPAAIAAPEAESAASIHVRSLIIASSFRRRRRSVRLRAARAAASWGAAWTARPSGSTTRAPPRASDPSTM